MERRDVEDMRDILKLYLNREAYDGEVAPPLAEAMDQELSSCMPMLKKLETLLQAHRRSATTKAYREQAEKEFEYCYAATLPFDGDIEFVTEQQPLPQIKMWSGPNISANTREEAEKLAALLGLNIVGHL